MKIFLLRRTIVAKVRTLQLVSIKCIYESSCLNALYAYKLKTRNDYISTKFESKRNELSQNVAVINAASPVIFSINKKTSVMNNEVMGQFRLHLLFTVS